MAMRPESYSPVTRNLSKPETKKGAQKQLQSGAQEAIRVSLRGLDSPTHLADLMAPISAYPRSTLRSLLKAWSPEGSATLSRDFDALAYVAYLTFLQRLAKESRIVAEGEAGVVRRKTGAIKKAKKLVLGKKEIRKAKKVSDALFDEL